MGFLSKVFSFVFLVLVLVGAVYFLTGDNLITANSVRGVQNSVGDATKEVGDYASESGIKEQARSKIDELFYGRSDLIEDIILLRQYASQGETIKVSELVVKLDKKIDSFDNQALKQEWSQVIECVNDPCNDSVFLDLINLANK